MEYSVLMSVYAKDQPDFLRTAIDSMLCQTVPPAQFVLVCDGPLTPALDEVIESYGERWMYCVFPKTTAGLCTQSCAVPLPLRAGRRHGQRRHQPARPL